MTNGHTVRAVCEFLPANGQGDLLFDDQILAGDVTWTPSKVEEFLPAIISDNRTPEWYALRYESGKEKLLFWCLDHIGLPYKHLTFLAKVKKRAKPVPRSWLPGYLFVLCDLRVDRWQQVVRMPHAIEYLGSPTSIPAAKFDDLCRRCPEHLAKPGQFSSVAPGTTVRIRTGPLQGHTAVVSWSDRKIVKLPILLFGSRDVEVTLKTKDVEVIG